MTKRPILYGERRGLSCWCFLEQGRRVTVSEQVPSPVNGVVSPNPDLSSFTPPISPPHLPPGLTLSTFAYKLPGGSPSREGRRGSWTRGVFPIRARAPVRRGGREEHSAMVEGS